MKGVDECLKVELDEIHKIYPEVEYIERNIRPDHVHMVVSFPPKYSIAQVVQVMKANAGGTLREKFDLRRDLVGWIFCEHSGLG